MTETDRFVLQEAAEWHAALAESCRTKAEVHMKQKEDHQAEVLSKRRQKHLAVRDAITNALRIDRAKTTSKANRAAFTTPTEYECAAYGLSIGLPSGEVSKFWDFYQSKGWKVGNVRMSDWKSAMRNWKRGWVEKNPGSATAAQKPQDPEGWREFLTLKCRAYKAFKYAPEDWQREFGIWRKNR